MSTEYLFVFTETFVRLNVFVFWILWQHHRSTAGVSVNISRERIAYPTSGQYSMCLNQFCDSERNKIEYEKRLKKKLRVSKIEHPFIALNDKFANRTRVRLQTRGKHGCKLLILNWKKSVSNVKFWLFSYLFSDFIRNYTYVELRVFCFIYLFRISVQTFANTSLTGVTGGRRLCRNVWS